MSFPTKTGNQIDDTLKNGNQGNILKTKSWWNPELQAIVWRKNCYFLCISRLLWNRYSGLRMDKAWYQIRCSSCYGGVHPIRSDLHGQLRISVPRSPNMIVNRSILPNSLFRSTRGISFPNSRNRSGMNRKHNSICFRCLGWGTLSCLFSSLSGFSSESALPS